MMNWGITHSVQATVGGWALVARRKNRGIKNFKVSRSLSPLNSPRCPSARLVQASAVAASAVKRVKGGQFHHHVTVHRIDVAAEKAARKAREQAAKRDKGESRKLLEAEIDRIIAAALEEDAREKAESGTNPVGDRSHAHASAQRNEGEAA